VYISLGTVFNGKPNVYRTLIAGAQAADASVIVSAGASEKALADLRSSTVQIFERVPQVELLEHVDAVITHGGNNTVQECLAAARPMVVIPFGGDQQANARRIERLGVGAAIPANELTPACVRDALMRLFDAQIVERARRLSQALGSYGGACAAADGILALAAAPVNVPSA
jgi:MGT family glycosyltransferase